MNSGDRFEKWTKAEGTEGILVEALERLARLGNEPHVGNSDGNMIARYALDEYRRLRLNAAEKATGTVNDEGLVEEVREWVKGVEVVVEHWESKDPQEAYCIITREDIEGIHKILSRHAAEKATAPAKCVSGHDGGCPWYIPGSNPPSRHAADEPLAKENKDGK